MQKENQRIARTKQLLRDALLKMLESRTIREISIRELCGKAGINRTTFYNHYGSQYDLLDDLSSRYLENVSACLNALEGSSRDLIERRVMRVFAYMEENAGLSALLLNNSVDPTFAERLFSLPQITELLNAALADCPDEREKAARIAFAIHGSYKLLRDWINTAERIPVKEQTLLILRLARKVCTE